MKWSHVIVTHSDGSVRRGKDAKAWVEKQFNGLVIDRGNDVVLLKGGGGYVFDEQAVRDLLIARSHGAITGFVEKVPVPLPLPAAPKPVRPTLANVIKTSPPRLAMHLDVDRDGRIDVEPANYTKWMWGLRPTGSGAIVLARLGTYRDLDVVSERAPIEFRWTGPYVDGWTATLSVDKPEKVRVFDADARHTGQQYGAPPVLCQNETGHTYQLDAPPDFNGIAYDQAIAVDPPLAVKACQKAMEKITGTFSDETALRKALQSSYLDQVRVAYRDDELDKFRGAVDSDRGALEPLAGKELKFRLVNAVGGQLKDRATVHPVLIGNEIVGKTFASFEDLKKAMVAAYESRIQLPSEVDFLSRLDELWGTIKKAAYRPTFKKNASYDFKAGVPVFDAVASSKEPARATRLWIEAVEIPDVVDDAAWEVTLTFLFTPPSGRGVPTEQRAVVRIAPWLMSNDLDPTAAIYAKNVGNADLIPIAAALRDFAATAKSQFVPVIAKTAKEKGFLRDLIKSGYATAPHCRQRVVMTGLDPRTHLIIGLFTRICGRKIVHLRVT